MSMFPKHAPESMLEVVYDITFNYAYQFLFNSPSEDPFGSDSRGRYTYILDLAEQFERRYASVDWNANDAPDYMISVDEFSFAAFKELVHG